MEDVSEQELKSILLAINTRYGIDLSNYEPLSLRRRLRKVIHKHALGSLAGLWVRVLREQGFIYQMIDDLTVGLTELFRNPRFWQYLQTEIMPRFAPSPHIHLWHAACSTGEEVYSMRILLHILGFAHKTHTLATDINQRALTAARSHRIHHLNLPAYRKNFQDFTHGTAALDTFLSPQSGHYFPLKKELTHQTHFQQQNLVNDPYPQKMDLIFCRNVLIYFDKALQQKVFHRLYESLNPGGYLILGFYDTQPVGLEDKLVAVDAGFKVYRRVG